MMNLPQLQIPVGTVVDYYATDRPHGPAVYQGQAKISGMGRSGCYRVQEPNGTYFNVHHMHVVESGQLLPAKPICQ